jgi:hypothetical protein
MLADSGPVDIAPGESRSFDFVLDPGAPRAEVRVHIEGDSTPPYAFTIDPRAGGMILPTLELIDAAGTTVASQWLFIVKQQCC